MNLRKVLLSPALALAFVAVAGLSSHAQTITYTIQNLFTGPNYNDFNISDTYSGTGYVGIDSGLPTNEGNPGTAFGELFGMEYYGAVYSETEMQANIAALSGATITNATLSYTLLNGQGGSQNATVTSFTANGTLSYNNAPPSDLGQVSFTSNGLSSNSVNVTSLVQGAVNADTGWVGLYLNGDGPGNNFQWTYSGASEGTSPDAADVRLIVTYTAGGTPEPGSLALFAGMGIAGTFAALRRRRVARKQA